MLDQLAVRIVLNLAIRVDVIPEVSRGDVTLIGCDAIGVRLADGSVAINIASEEAKRDIAMRLSIAVDVFRMENDGLHIGHT